MAAMAAASERAPARLVAVIATYRSSAREQALVLLQIDRPALLPKLSRLLVHPFPGFLTQLLCQLHAAELWAAHRTEVRHFGAVGRERLVVVGARGDWIERQIELILPSELEPRL